MTKQSAYGVGMGGRIQCHGGLGWLAGTERMPEGVSVRTGLAESPRFMWYLISLWPMWSPIPESMACL